MNSFILKLLSVAIAFTVSCTEGAIEEKQDLRTKTNRGNKDGRPAVDQGVPLSEIQQGQVNEIALILGLTEIEAKILTDLMMRDHPAIDPLYKLIKSMEGKLAPYIKDKWMLFSEHQILLKQKIDEKQAEINALKIAIEAKDAVISSKEETLEARNKTIADKEEDIKKKQAAIIDLTEDLADLQRKYDEILTSWKNSLKEISYLLGHTDRDGRPLESIIISDIESANALPKAIIINGKSTSLRALATYTGSTTKRDVSHLATWSITQRVESPNIQQDALSSYVFKGLKLGSDAYITAAININSQTYNTTIPTEVLNAVNIAYSFSMYDDKSSALVDPAMIPLGVRGRLILKARFTDERGNLITESDLTGSATFSVANQNETSTYTGSAVLLNSERRLRPGLFYGIKTGTVKFRATVDGTVLDKDVTLKEAEDEFYLYAGIGVNFESVAQKLEYLECPLPAELMLLKHSTPPPPLPSNDFEEYRGISFTGTTIHPGLNTFKSSCQLVDISKQASFRPADRALPDDAIKKSTTAENGTIFIAHRPTAIRQKLEAYWDNNTLAKIDTVNSWSISIEHRKLTDLTISEDWPNRHSTCYEWTGNYSLSEDVSPGPAQSEDSHEPDGAGTQVRRVLVIDSDQNPQSPENPYLTYVHPLQPGQPARLENIVGFENGIKGFALDLSDMTGIIDRDGSLMPGALLDSNDIALYEEGAESQTPLPAQIKIIPGGGYDTDRSIITLNTATRNTWIKIVVKRSTKTGVINEWIRWVGHFDQGTAPTNFEAPSQPYEGYVHSPYNISKYYYLAVAWNDCMFEGKFPTSTGLAGNTNLAMIDPNGEPTAELGSFGRRWQQTSFTYNPQRPYADRNVVVRAQFDYSQYCYRPDPDQTPKECESLVGYRQTDLEKPEVIEKPELSQALGIENFYPVQCRTGGRSDSGTTQPQPPRLTELLTEFKLMPIRDESYLDAEYKLKCGIMPNENLSSNLMAMDITHVESLELANNSDPFTWKLQLKETATNARLQLHADIKRDGSSEVSRGFDFAIERSSGTNCLKNARLDPTNPSIAIFEIPLGTGDKAWNSKENLVYINRACNITTLRIQNNDSVRHTLHTNGRPCPHQQTSGSMPGTYYDCALAGPYDFPPNDPYLYDHNYSPSAVFYLKVD